MPHRLTKLLVVLCWQELLQYLSEFLGSDTPAIRDFADQVARFKRNEPLVVETPNVKPPARTKPSTLDPPAKEVRPSTRTTSSSSTSKEVQKGQSTAASLRNVRGTSAKTAEKPKAPPVSTAASAPQDRSPAKPTAQEPTKPVSVPKSRPRQGNNPVKCGCYGRIHSPLTNCLYCGRVACEREGYSFCAYCGYIVEEVVAPPSAEGGGDTAAAAAWRHKERLLRYDRDFAARTTVFDDQADYYSQDSAWLTAEERERAEQQEREKREELLRKRMQLNLRIG
jgi:activating signal cointegrator 1